MNLKRTAAVIATLYAFAALFPTQGQATSVFSLGYTAPNKIINAGQSSMLVSEAGTLTPNTGRISLVNRATGARQTLISNLPSGINRAEGQPAPAGPSGVKLIGSKLYVSIGQGDSVVTVTTGGLAINDKPDTPLNNSVLEFTLPADYETVTSPFSLSYRNQFVLVNAGGLVLQNAQGKLMGVRLVANLPDHKPDPRPNLPNNVRPANLYGLDAIGNNLYVVDASFNQIYSLNPDNGESATLAVFAPRQNPLPFGPPVFEAVPDSIRLFKGQLLVTFLTGFPFPQNLAEVRRVDPSTGVHETFISGLSAAIDIVPVPLAGNNDSFYVLEFSANFLGQPQAPGRLKLLTPAADRMSLTSTTLISNLISPTSMARDAESGDVFITEIFTGRIIRMDAAR